MKRKGFTLVEIIVSLTIFSMLLGGILYAFGVELKFWERVVAKSEKQQIANIVLAKIARDIRSAKQILPPSNNKILLLKIGSDTIEYSLTNKKIRRRKNNYSSYLTDEDDIQYLSFSYPAANLVRIEVEDFKTRIAARN